MASSPHKYAVMITAIIPVEDEAAGRAFPLPNDWPFNTVIVADIVEELDLQHPTEWEPYGFQHIERVRIQTEQKGWPMHGAVQVWDHPEEPTYTPDDPINDPVPEPVPEPEVPAAALVGDDQSCPVCTTVMITSMRGTFCPNDACGYDPESDRRQAETDAREPREATAAELRIMLAEAEDAEKTPEQRAAEQPKEPVGKLADNPVRTIGDEIEGEVIPQNIQGKSTGGAGSMNSYSPTPEDPKPTSFPQGEPIPTTD